MKSRRARRFVIAAAGLATILGLGGAAASSTAKPDFAVAASPHDASVIRGNNVQYDLAITRSNGFHGAVSLAMHGLPAGISGSFSSDPAGTASHRTLMVSTTPSASVGTFALAVTGTSGQLKHATVLVLAVTKPPTPAFNLAVSPANLNVSAGLSGSYTVTTTRTNLSAPIGFTVTGLPAHATAAFGPASTSGNSTTLTVQIASNSPLGSYSLVINGTSGTITASVTAHLTVSAGQGRAFTIAGVLDRALSPGVTGYLDLALTNPNNQTLSITNLAVSITGTSKSGCTASGNFSKTEFSGTYPLSLPSNSTRTLSQLGVPQSQWPKVTMVNLAMNQDICKSTSLTLGFTGTGIGN